MFFGFVSFSISSSHASKNSPAPSEVQQNAFFRTITTVLLILLDNITKYHSQLTRIWSIFLALSQVTVASFSPSKVLHSFFHKPDTLRPNQSTFFKQCKSSVRTDHSN